MTESGSEFTQSGWELRFIVPPQGLRRIEGGGGGENRLVGKPEAERLRLFLALFSLSFRSFFLIVFLVVFGSISGAILECFGSRNRVKIRTGHFLIFIDFP